MDEPLPLASSRSISRRPGGPDDLLDAPSVASWLGVRTGWVYAETRAGRIPHVTLGRYYRYRRSSIEAWLEELEHR